MITLRNKMTSAALACALAVATSLTAWAADTMATGEVKKVDADAGKITIKHGPIPSLQMDAMTMVFKAKTDDLVKSVKAGDKIRFVAESVNGQLTVTQIEKGK
jgi:Cu/Ag efflux protein CusF